MLGLEVCKAVANGLLPAGQTGAQDLAAALDNIFNHPNVGPFIAKQLIQKLVRATLRGMRDIMADPKAATVAYVNHLPVHKGKEASIQKVFELYNKYVYAGQKVPGTMDEARLGELQKFYVNNGVVPKETPLKELYTNQFVGK